MQESIKFLEDTTKELLKLLGVEAGVAVSLQKAESEEDKDFLRVDLSGEDLGLLIGYHGTTLSSIQLFLNCALYNKTGEWQGVLVDIEGYRDEQAQRLHAIADKIADRVRFSGEAYQMRPMPSFERKIIHTYLSQMEDLATESQGEGNERHIVVKIK